MWVITADQIGSRRGSDLVPEALEILGAVPTVLPFTRTVGDEIQGVVPTAADALEATLLLVRDGRWSIGLGGGEARLAQDSRASDGPAFVHARAAVERAKGRRPRSRWRWRIPAAVTSNRSCTSSPPWWLSAARRVGGSWTSWRTAPPGSRRRTR